MVTFILTNIRFYVLLTYENSNATGFSQVRST